MRFLFLKMSKIESKFRKGKNKKKQNKTKKKIIEKKFFFCETIVSENVAINMLSEEENTCHQQSMG